MERCPVQPQKVGNPEAVPRNRAENHSCVVKPVAYQSSVVTPVNVKCLACWLDGYDHEKSKYLLKGFEFGFKIPYTGKRVFRQSRNLKSALDNLDILKQKICFEVQNGRAAGPFSLDNLPFPNLQISPLGLVPKQTPGEFRVIHHLSHPEGSSINDGISKEDSAVSYQTVDDAVTLVKRFGKGCLLSKTDIEHGYKNIPIHPSDHELLGFAVGTDVYYDKTLPMGLSFSCNLFEKLSTAIHWVANNKLHIEGLVHLLDDFLLVGPPSAPFCNSQLQLFLQFFNEVGIPLKQEKTVYPTTILTFLGLELDTQAMEIRLPQEKLLKIRNRLAEVQYKKKLTLQELQSLIGLLNFACAVVVPGRPFLRRVIDLTKGLEKPHHRRKLSKEARADIAAWEIFIRHFNGASMFLEDEWQTSQTLSLYTDASGLGFGGIFGTKWFSDIWEQSWECYHISVKELFPIVVAVQLWGHHMKNKKVCFFSDNMAVVHIINKQTSKDPLLMTLLRRLIVECMRCNILFQAKHVPGIENILSDRLSRLQISEFKKIAPQMDRNPTVVPEWMFKI